MTQSNNYSDGCNSFRRSSMNGFWIGFSFLQCWFVQCSFFCARCVHHAHHAPKITWCSIVSFMILSWNNEWMNRLCDGKRSNVSFLKASWNRISLFQITLWKGSLTISCRNLIKFIQLWMTLISPWLHNEIQINKLLNKTSIQALILNQTQFNVHRHEKNLSVSSFRKKRIMIDCNNFNDLCKMYLRTNFPFFCNNRKIKHNKFE